MKADIRGISYNYEHFGQGEPLLLLHGFTGSMDTWRFFSDALPNKYHLIFVDIIGHGKTDCPTQPERYTMSEVVEDLVALLDLLHLSKAHVLGYSMGGRLALNFACQFPERVLSLMLESASPGLKSEEERRLRREHDRKLAESILEEGITSFVDRWETLALFASQDQLPEQKRKALRKQRLANNPRGLACSLIGMGTGAQPSRWSQLSFLSMPVLLITGDQDLKFCKIAEEMKTRLSRAEWQVVKNSGHAVHLEQAKLYPELIADFVTRHSPGIQKEDK